MKYCVIIPARMKSTRFPGKPLHEIMGKSLLLRTYDQCLKAVDRSLIYVATDHKEIEAHCLENNIKVITTSEECLTGTDRVAEAARSIESDYYINVQGDEPLINPDDIKIIIESCNKYNGEIINGYAEIENSEMWVSKSVPKVVKRQDGRLLYMSRAPIPGNKEGVFKKGMRQICIYGFPKKALIDFAKYNKKSDLEEIEDIEILRFLELGHEVRMIELSNESIAVDHIDDVKKVINKLQSK